jgi:sporulation protein YlmC with PRC-barrel domain
MKCKPIMAATEIIGRTVTNSRGEKLGRIEDIVIDGPRGQVAYAVLSFGGFLGVGDRLCAIPWDVLVEDPHSGCLLLDVDKDRLRKAPGFDKHHWPDMADDAWASEVYEYYGVEPYWGSKTRP